MSNFAAERLTGVGGSDAPAAVGISPWRTPYDLWCEKLGETEPVALNEPMRWGTLLEPVIIIEYASRTGRMVERPEEMLRHRQFPWMIGHIDGCVIGEPRIVEAKTAGTARGWGEPGSDEVPLHYLMQVHHYLTVSDAEIADIAVLIGGQDFRIYTIERDEAIGRMLIDQEAQFWRYVEKREPPPTVNTADAIRRWGRLTLGGLVTATEAQMIAIDRLREIREKRRELDESEDIARHIVMQALSDRGDALTDLAGTVLATWRLDKGRASYNVAARGPQRRFVLKE